MKYFLLIFSFTNLLLLRGYSQITLTPGIVSTTVNTDSFEVKCRAILKNTSSKTRRFTWKRNTISISNGWQSYVCNSNRCGSTTNNTSPDTIYLAPNATSILDVYVRPNHISGSATIEVKVSEVGRPVNTITGRYLFTSAVSEMRKNSVMSGNINVYPNPTTDYFMLTEDSDAVDRVVIYNIIGRQVKSYKAMSNVKYTVADLPEGIYIIRLLNSNGSTLRTIRLNRAKVKA